MFFWRGFGPAFFTALHGDISKQSCQSNFTLKLLWRMREQTPQRREHSLFLLLRAEAGVLEALRMDILNAKMLLQCGAGCTGCRGVGPCGGCAGAGRCKAGRASVLPGMFRGVACALSVRIICAHHLCAIRAPSGCIICAAERRTCALPKANARNPPA